MMHDALEERSLFYNLSKLSGYGPLQISFAKGPGASLRSGSCLSPSTEHPPPLSRFEKDSSEIGRNVQCYLEFCMFACRSRDLAALGAGV
jgi:hypothetical protein